MDLLVEARLVDKALNAPGKCLVTGDFDGPFIDTGCWASVDDPYVYLHVPLIEYYGRELLGMVSQEKVEELKTQVAEQAEEIDKLRQFVAATEGLVEATQELERAASA